MAKYDLEPAAFDCTGARIGIACARFNQEIVGALLDGATRALAEHGIADADIELVRVPGAFELPLATQTFARRADIDAVIAVGAVIRGGTPHFEYVSGSCTDGLTRVALDTGKPVIFGVLTVDDMEQARARIGGSEGDKGFEAGLAALEMITVLRQSRA